MPQFDSKTFNAEVFGKYLERVPRVKQDKLLEAGVLRPRRALRALLGDHAGGNYITVPMLGLIDGEPLNYDGETDLTAVSTRTYAQSMVVVGRMKAWEEKDFAADITGADFMDNVAMQVAEYWDGVDEDTLLAILKGVFAMTGEGNAEFVDRHTYDVTAAAEPYVGATTLNSAIQRAAGANKGIFRVVVCHSAVSTNLENLAAVEYLKYTDKRGVTRDLGLASWNGRLLLVDDEPTNLHVLRQILGEDYRLQFATDGRKALQLAQQQKPDLILLDINMPGMDGLQLCKTIRDEVSCPILFLSARDAEQDKINGLLIGGDDYITKPFSLPEVAARIAAHLRRETRVHDPSRLLAAQELLVNLSRRTVHFKGTEIEFSKREFDILELLLTHAGQVFDRERIYETVWGLNASGDSGVVKEHIRKIRQKLQSVAGEDYIETVWGVGYRWKQ